jgi:hypothetical protein
VSDGLQEGIAVAIAVLAAVYLVAKLTGWRAKRRSRKAPVVVGERLARGLKNRGK